MGNFFIFKSIKKLAFSNVAKSTSYVFVGNSISAVFSFFFTIILVRYLSIADYGYFTALLSFMILVTTFSDIGIGTTLTAFVPTLKGNRVHENKFLKSAFVVQLICILVIFILVTFSGKFFSYFLLKNAGKSILITTIGIVSIFNVLCNFFIFSLSARKQFYKIGLQAVFGSIVRFVLLLFLIFLSKVTLETVIWLEVVHLGILTLFLFFLLNSKFIYARFDTNDAKKLLSFSPFIGISKIVSSLYSRLDIIMLVAFGSSIDAGLYSIAIGILSVFQLLSISFVSVIAPNIASISGIENAKKFLGKIIFAVSILVGIVIVLIFTSHSFMEILFGNKGESAASVLQLLLFGIIFYLAVIPFSSLILYYFKKPYILTLNDCIQLIIIIGGNLYFIPRYGRFGPTYSLILAYVSTFLISMFWVIHEFGNSKKILR